MTKVLFAAVGPYWQRSVNYEHCVNETPHGDFIKPYLTSSGENDLFHNRLKCYEVSYGNVTKS